MAIECPQCKLISSNPNDEAQLYCGACHQFHTDMRLVYEVPRRMRAKWHSPYWKIPKELKPHIARKGEIEFISTRAYAIQLFLELDREDEE